jgi:thiol-disulfide isomerase/thioredoxin/outer membrane lipoprotein-sorting protein
MLAMQARALTLVLFLAAPALLAQPPASSPAHLAQASTQAADAAALKLLQEVGQKYAKATRSHIESVTETHNSGEVTSSWGKYFVFEYEAPGNRYVFGGRNFSGSGLVVSDGTTEWELHAAFGEYVKRPAGTYGHPLPKVASLADGPMESNAFQMRQRLGSYGTSAMSVHFHPEETIRVGDREIRCLVIGYAYPQDFPKSPNYPGNATSYTKVWIDKARMLIVRTEATSNDRMFGSVGKGVVSHAVTTVDYPIVSLDEPIPDDAFKFVPPPDAKLVDNFTDQQAALRKIVASPAPATAVRSPQGADADALNLLHQVTQKYAKAIRSHIESMQEVHNSGDLRSWWRKDFTTEIEAPGNRYVFGGKAFTGAVGLVVSDGATEYELHSAYGEYIKRPAGTYNPFKNDPPEAQGPREQEAYLMRRELGTFGGGLQSAHLQPEETIQAGGRQIRCLVIGFGIPDYRNTTQNPEFLTHDQKVWIDKARLVIVRTELTEDRRIFGSIGKGIVEHGVVTVDYPIVSLDESIPDDALKFGPPPDAKLVDNFTDQEAAYRKAAGLPEPAPKPVPPASYPANTARAALQVGAVVPVGTAVPDLTLFAADGRSLDLRTLRGKPVLIDLWATWCGPCLLEMPVIDRIYRFGKPAGLVVVGLDQDKNPADALNYLQKNAYGWDDYSDYHNGQYVSVSLHPGGLPTLILIDADGKVAYFHVGADDDPGLVAAVRKLGPAFAAAMDQAEK